MKFRRVVHCQFRRITLALRRLRGAAKVAIFSVNMEPAYGKGSFVRALPRRARVLDVGCGNGSPAWFRSVRSDLYYVGVDVGDCNQPSDPHWYADEYVICTAQDFAATLGRYAGQMDAVVSNHNLEHCNEPERVIDAMVRALRPGGRLYLAFPCEESVRFPKRRGCLNFFDDSTHQHVPSWRKTIDALSGRGCEITFRAKRYRPFPLWLRGLAMEPISIARRRTMPDGSTWALYGFESVIWAQTRALDVELANWGPQEARAGEGVNVQPSGESAIWIQAKNLPGFGETWVEFGPFRAPSPAMVGRDVVTTAVPEHVLARPGHYPVSLVEASGRRTLVGTFAVVTP